MFNVNKYKVQKTTIYSHTWTKCIDFYCHWHVHKIIQEYIIFLDLIKYLIDVHCILNQPYSHKMLEAK